MEDRAFGHLSGWFPSNSHTSAKSSPSALQRARPPPLLALTGLTELYQGALSTQILPLNHVCPPYKASGKMTRKKLPSPPSIITG